MDFRGAGDRNNPRLLSQYPGQGDLGGSSLLLLCKSFNRLDQSLVDLAVFGIEPGDLVAEIIGVELRVCADFAGKKAFAQGAEGDESDAQFFEGRQHSGFGLSPPEGVFALERAHGLNSVSATDGLDAGFGQAEVLYL